MYRRALRLSAAPFPPASRAVLTCGGSPFSKVHPAARVTPCETHCVRPSLSVCPSIGKCRCVGAAVSGGQERPPPATIGAYTAVPGRRGQTEWKLDCRGHGDGGGRQTRLRSRHCGHHVVPKTVTDHCHARGVLPLHILVTTHTTPHTAHATRLVTSASENKLNHGEI